jgi:hypothetical protein
MQLTKNFEATYNPFDPQHNQHIRAFNKVRRPQSKERNQRAIRAGAALFATAGIAIGVNALSHKSETSSINGPHKEYIVKPYDTAWSISEKAFPGDDPREHTDAIMNQAGEVLNPGETITLPDDSKIGTEVVKPTTVRSVP